MKAMKKIRPGTVSTVKIDGKGMIKRVEKEKDTDTTQKLTSIDVLCELDCPVLEATMMMTEEKVETIKPFVK